MARQHFLQRPGDRVVGDRLLRRRCRPRHAARQRDRERARRVAVEVSLLLRFDEVLVGHGCRVAGASTSRRRRGFVACAAAMGWRSLCLWGLRRRCVAAAQKCSCFVAWRHLIALGLPDRLACAPRVRRRQSTSERSSPRARSPCGTGSVTLGRVFNAANRACAGEAVVALLELLKGRASESSSPSATAIRARVTGNEGERERVAPSARCRPLSASPSATASRCCESRRLP
mmetsp:Transcript_14213/g.44004  ORF Transcript_14213/g.44004 Transcript_14213/m.44004 type:complete len:231 (+) Transcript_14213:203-895(+)